MRKIRALYGMLKSGEEVTAPRALVYVCGRGVVRVTSVGNGDQTVEVVTVVDGGEVRERGDVPFLLHMAFSKCVEIKIEGSGRAPELVYDVIRV